MLNIEKLNQILLALLGNQKLVSEWWASPNKAFNMEKPLNVYISDPDKVSKYILSQLESPH